MSMIYVKPAPGGRIRMPDRNFLPMPEVGAWVSRDMHYSRLLLSKDVIECEPPAVASPTPPTNEAPASKGAPRK